MSRLRLIAARRGPTYTSSMQRCRLTTRGADCLHANSSLNTPPPSAARRRAHQHTSSEWCLCNALDGSSNRLLLARRANPTRGLRRPIHAGTANAHLGHSRRSLSSAPSHRRSWARSTHLQGTSARSGATRTSTRAQAPRSTASLTSTASSSFGPRASPPGSFQISPSSRCGGLSRVFAPTPVAFCALTRKSFRLLGSSSRTSSGSRWSRDQS